MSVDKFGRHQSRLFQASIRGLPGVGFKTTAEGDYDMSSKRLRMVGEPNEDNDAVTMKYVTENSLPLKKVDTNNTFFDANKRVIRNLKEPINRTDAVNKVYMDSRIPLLNYDGWHFFNKRLVNVGEPKLGNDAVNKAYVEKQIPIRDDGKWDFSDMRLSNVAAPTLDGDCINLSFLKNNVLNPLTSIKETALALDTTADAYDAKGKCITNLRDAVKENEAVNLHLINAFRESIEKKFSDMQDKFEDELSSMAYLIAQRLNDPQRRRTPPTTKQKPWRSNFDNY